MWLLRLFVSHKLDADKHSSSSWRPNEGLWPVFGLFDDVSLQVTCESLCCLFNRLVKQTAASHLTSPEPADLVLFVHSALRLFKWPRVWNQKRVWHIWPTRTKKTVKQKLVQMETLSTSTLSALCGFYSRDLRPGSAYLYLRRVQVWTSERGRSCRW